MLDIQDMEYRIIGNKHPDHGGCNERYTGWLNEGVAVVIERNGWAGRDWWGWSAYTAQDYPIQTFLWSSNQMRFPSAEEALADFHESYRVYCERQAVCGHVPRYYRCLECGWQGEAGEIGSQDVCEDYGDVSCLVCPGCNRIQYDGMVLLVEIDG